MERDFKVRNSVDAFRVLNTPIRIRKNREARWDAIIPIAHEGLEWYPEFTIAVSVRTKTEACEEVEKYLARRFP